MEHFILVFDETLNLCCPCSSNKLQLKISKQIDYETVACTKIDMTLDEHLCIQKFQIFSNVHLRSTRFCRWIRYFALCWKAFIALLVSSVLNSGTARIRNFRIRFLLLFFIFRVLLKTRSFSFRLSKAIEGRVLVSSHFIWDAILDLVKKRIGGHPARWWVFVFEIFIFLLVFFFLFARINVNQF